MISLLLAVTLAAIPSDSPSPAEVHAAALGDLVKSVPIERHRDTRYLSLHAAAPGPERDTLYRSLVFALNSTSFRSKLYSPPRVYGGVLVRLNLSGLAWDVGSRQARIALLQQQGVDTATFKPDLWEEIAKDDPYFFSTYVYPEGGKIARGWVDPKFDYQLRLETQSTRAIVRADWLIPRLLQEKDNGGYYSAALLLPPTEDDLYKAFGVDVKLFNADPSLKSGGAVLDSIVALHNRELQLGPNLYGWDEKFVWRTFDFNKDATGDKSVIESLAGTAKHDGREIIFTLPNGLHGYYLSNGAGTQVAVVPQNIAIDQTDAPLGKIKDRSVINAFSCVRCHGPAGGIQPFTDVVGPAMLAPKNGFAVFAKGKERQIQLLADVEAYYLSGLPAKIARQNASYAARVKECNGLDPGPNSVAINNAVEGYQYALVTPAQAAREQGWATIQLADIAWRNSGNSYLNLLSSGQPVRRAAFESAFADGMKSNVYPWDSKP